MQRVKEMETSVRKRQREEKNWRKRVRSNGEQDGRHRGWEELRGCKRRINEMIKKRGEAREARIEAESRRAQPAQEKRRDEVRSVSSVSSRAARGSLAATK